MNDSLRSWWQNCYGPDDKGSIDDEELQAIDALEDSIAPLDDITTAIRQCITRFEACYHEADKQAELITKAIGSGAPPEGSDERPPQRKQELQNSHDILVAWCDGTSGKCTDLEVGAIGADELVGYLGEPTALKIWQVQRVIDRLKQALDPSYCYHWMAFDVGEYGQAGTDKPGDHYKDQPDFLDATKAALINDTVDGEKAQISLALAIDFLTPCSWNFVGNLAICLKAIGGDLHPDKPLAPHARNIRLTPLRGRLEAIAGTLQAFCSGRGVEDDVDHDILAVLADKTPVKRWLAASLDKTIRLQLYYVPPDFDQCFT
ncbi:MAG: hypothetical protein ACYSTF_00715 [Planctomycetota bacterium]|jgi:hypothetical protein